MAGPILNIKSFTRSKISNKSGYDASTVVFSTNQDLIQWEARADGQGVGQGLLVGSGGELPLESDWKSRTEEFGANWNNWGMNWNQLIYYAESSFRVDDEELKNGDKTYRINLYGKNLNGEWSKYG